MIKVKGIYEGMCVKLLEPIALAPETVVEVLIPEGPTEQGQEYEFLRRLVAEGLLASGGPMLPSEEIFEPVPIRGIPLSQTLIEERR